MVPVCSQIFGEWVLRKEHPNLKKLTDKHYDLYSAKYALKKRDWYESRILKRKLCELTLEKKTGDKLENVKDVNDLPRAFAYIGHWLSAHIWREILERSEVCERKSINDKLQRYSSQFNPNTDKRIYDENKIIRLWERLDVGKIEELAEALYSNKYNKQDVKQFKGAAKTLEAYFMRKSEASAL